MNHSRSFKIASLRLGTILVGIASAWALVACQSHVPKQAMEEMAAYSTAVCACTEKDPSEAKPCIETLKMPSFDKHASTLLGNPKYKLESLHAYTNMWGIGYDCAKKVGAVVYSP